MKKQSKEKKKNTKKPPAVKRWRIKPFNNKVAGREVNNLMSLDL